MKFRSLMTAICVLATANIVSAAPFAYIANSGTKNVTVIDTSDNSIVTNVALPDDNGAALPNPYAYGVAVGASGQYAYIGLQDTNEVTVIDTATNAVAKRISLGTDTPGGLAVNAAETRLYVASNKSNTLIVIDISGSGASEVSRVAVDTSAMSNPEGVVLSPDGTKAYVANSTKGSIAEISLDEVNNIYSRIDTVSGNQDIDNIALGNNAQPMGLTISSDGKKLYAAGFNGNVSLIDTVSRVVTNLPLGISGDPVVPDGNGNLSVAITTDNNKIYAPLAGYDNLYYISGTTVTRLGGQKTLQSSPWGSSVTPDGAKLYVAMNLSDNVKVLSTTTDTVTATIPLAAGAKPTSLGDFIGPVFDATITSANQSGCTITPLGAIPVVKNFGRSFTVVTVSGQCEIFTGCNTTDFTGGTSQGITGSYAFTNIQANDTICAINKTGTYFTLSGDWISSVGGCLQSSPTGVSCASKSQNVKFPAGTIVTLSPSSTDYRVQPGTWAGVCAGSTATCQFTMDADKSFGTTTVVEFKPTGTGPIFNSTKSSYYQTLADATDAASTLDVIKISSAYTTGGSTTGTAGVTVTLSGNWDAGFSAQSGSVSMGALTITDVAVIADNVTL